MWPGSGGQEVLGGGGSISHGVSAGMSVSTWKCQSHSLAPFSAATPSAAMPSRAPIAPVLVGNGSEPGPEVVIGGIYLIHRPQQPSRESRLSRS
jgi:hypothetical protein